MPVKLSRLLRVVSAQLYDEANEDWSQRELLDWITESLGALAEIRPDAFTRTRTQALVGGARQEPDADVERVVRVLSSGPSQAGPFRAVTHFDLATMNAVHPTWQTDPPAQMRQFSLVHDATAFWVYPPQPAGDPGYAVVEAVVIPEIPSAEDAGFAEHEIDVDQRFQRALVDYTLYRAFMKDSDTGDASARAQHYYAAFRAGTGQPETP